MYLEGTPSELHALKSLALYNYGHFTSMRVEKMRVRGLSMHLARLASDSNRLFGRAIDVDRAREYVRQAARNGSEPMIVRVTVFAPDFEMNRPGRDVEPEILVTSRPAPPMSQESWRVKSLRYARDLPTVKHLGLFGQLFQRRIAQREGFDDALFVDSNSFVLEGATWNVGFIKASELIWPKSDCLPGVTLRLLQESLGRSGVESQTLPVHLLALAEMDSAFATNAATGVRPISRIDDREFGVNGELLARLSASYWELPGEEV